MKTKFIEYYPYSTEEIKEILKNGLIVLDTNVLLNLYRCTDKTRAEFFKILKIYAKQLWLPYQVAYEYHQNRKKVISSSMASFRQLDDIVSKAFSNLHSTLQIDSMPLSVNKEALKNLIEKFKKKILEETSRAQKSYPNFSEKDNVLDSITELYNGFVGDDYSEEELGHIYNEGKERYAKQIPPGYCDLKEKGNSNISEMDERRLYGDLIIWKSVINKSKIDKKDIVFVTDDMKEDWWEKIGGKHSPRVELIREFTHETEQKIKFYNFKSFLNYLGIEKTTEGKKAMLEFNSLNKKYYQIIFDSMKNSVGSTSLDNIKKTIIQDESVNSSHEIIQPPSKNSNDNIQGDISCN